MKKITLISGAVLEVGAANFREGKDLFDAISKSIKDNYFDPKQEIDINFIKNLSMTLVSDKNVEEKLWPILSRCLRDREKINEKLFDDNMEAREDFIEICYHVTLESVSPFIKNLYGKFKPKLVEIGLILP